MKQHPLNARMGIYMMKEIHSPISLLMYKKVAQWKLGTNKWERISKNQSFIKLRMG